MPFIGGAVVRVNPSHVLPQVLMKYSQPSGAFELLATGDPMVQLEMGDLFVYVNAIDVRTQVAGSQSSYNELPSATVEMTQDSTPVYNFRTRAEYDHRDVSAASRWGIPLVQAYQLAGRQGIYQQARNNLLYGSNPSLGEGLLNTPQATTVTLPPDSNGATTFSTYDNGQLAIFFLTQITQAETRTLQIGMPTRIEILGPQRIIAAMTRQNIVQVTSYQRAGAGTATTGVVITETMKENGDTVGWGCDDTLIGKGAGGSDAVVITIPEVQAPRRVNRVDTNIFASLQPGLLACNIMLSDMVAPLEISSPMAGGAIDTLYEQAFTSGWALRPEATTIVSIPFA